MNPIEESLRRVLAKGSADDPDYRVGIYEASERAIARLFADGKIDEAGRDSQHERLIAAIEAIEADYPPAGGDGATEAAPPPEPAADAAPAQSETPARSRATPVVPGPMSAPDPIPPGAVPGVPMPVPAKPPASDPGGQARLSLERRTAPAAGRKAPATRRLPPAVAALTPRQRLVYGLALAAVVAVLALALFLVLPRLLGGDAGSAGDTAAALAAPGGWITVFSADRPEGVTTPNGGSIEVVAGEGGRAALRVALPDTASEGDILFPVGPGVLSRLAGGPVQVEIEAGSPDGAARAFAVRCPFGAQAACGRQRFSVSRALEPFLFAMDTMDAGGGTAAITLDPAIGGPGSAVDVYAIRMRAS